MNGSLKLRQLVFYKLVFSLCKSPRLYGGNNKWKFSIKPRRYTNL